MVFGMVSNALIFSKSITHINHFYDVNHGKFFLPALTGGFHWSLSNSKKSSQFSRTSLSIIADFNSVVVRTVSTLHRIFSSIVSFLYS